MDTTEQRNTYCQRRVAGGHLCTARIAVNKTMCSDCERLYATVPASYRVLAAADRIELQDKVYNAALNAWLPVTTGDAGLNRTVRECGVLAARRRGEA